MANSYSYKHALLSIIFICFIGQVGAEEVQDENDQFKCTNPSSSERIFDNTVIYSVGRAVIAPRGTTWFSDVELCMFGWYVSDKFSLAGYTSTTHHALLTMMSADPEQFFTVIKEHKPAGYFVWLSSLEHATLWLMSAECPDPDPLQQAARSITGFSFKDVEMEEMRLDILGKLRTLKCRVPDEE